MTRWGWMEIPPWILPEGRIRVRRSLPLVEELPRALPRRLLGTSGAAGGGGLLVGEQDTRSRARSDGEVSDSTPAGARLYPGRGAPPGRLARCANDSWVTASCGYPR